MKPSLPTIGRIVHLTLSADQAHSINRNPAIGGSAVNEGETYPLIITRVWPVGMYESGLVVNGHVLLDAPNNLWVTCLHHGDQPGQWHWPHLEGGAELKACVSSFDLTAVSAEIAERANRLQAENETLRADLERTRKHETHLIQERDRLIHKDIADLHKQLCAAHDKIKTRTDQFNNVSEHANSLTTRLNETAERERRLSERLANIASLVSDM